MLSLKMFIYALKHPGPTLENTHAARPAHIKMYAVIKLFTHTVLAAGKLRGTFHANSLH